VSFFAPHQGYSSHQDPMGPLDEFRCVWINTRSTQV
jgi:pullulanase/glycogen debranching enzyme